MQKLKFKGSINKLYDDSYEIEGTIHGIMVLPDDITLELIDYEFETEIEETFYKDFEERGNYFKELVNSI